MYKKIGSYLPPRSQTDLTATIRCCVCVVQLHLHYNSSGFGPDCGFLESFLMLAIVAELQKCFLFTSVNGYDGWMVCQSFEASFSLTVSYFYGMIQSLTFQLCISINDIFPGTQGSCTYSLLCLSLVCCGNQINVCT